MSFQTRFFSALAFASLTCLSTPVLASTSGVSSATVSKDRLSVEARTAYGTDNESQSQDDRLRTRIHLDYGVTDYYAARLVVKQNKNKGNHLRHDGIDFVNRFHLLNAKDYGFHLGARLSFSYQDGANKPDEAEIRFIQQIPINDWEIRLNQMIAHEVGAEKESGLIAAMRFEISHPIATKTRLALQAYNDFGNLRRQEGYSAQAHQLGVMAKYELTEKADLQIGYLKGVSRDAQDHAVRLFIGTDF